MQYLYILSSSISGLFVDGPANGLAPLPWDIVVNPPEMFKDDSCSIIVPHTASVKVQTVITG